MNNFKRYNIFFGNNKISDLFDSIYYLFNNNYKDSKIIERYHSQLSNITGCKYIYSFGSGRMALYSILKALNINKNDEIIVPAYTCAVVVNAIIYSGAIPVYADINLRDFNINTEDLKSKINQNTKALYAQHTFGNVCNYKAINEIAKKNNLIVIEDGAHALGGTTDNKQIGSLTDISFFSTDHSKTINTQYGGFVATNNETYNKNLKINYEKINYLKNTVIKKIIFSFIYEYVFFSKYFYFFGKYLHIFLIKLNIIFYFDDINLLSIPTKYSYPCKLSSFQAKLGLNELNRLEENLKSRFNKYLKYNELFKYNNKVYKGLSLLRYSMLVKDQKKFESLFKNIDLGIWFKTILEGRNDNFVDVHYIKGTCKNAEFAAKHIVNFPTHSRIEIQKLEKFLNKNINWISKNIIK